jgi:hypothetical protein
MHNVPEKETSMKIVIAGLLAIVSLGGCVAVPYYAGPSRAYVAPPPVYVAPAPVYHYGYRPRYYYR